jgi:hypothetical protein
MMDSMADDEIMSNYSDMEISQAQSLGDKEEPQDPKKLEEEIGGFESLKEVVNHIKEEKKEDKLKKELEKKKNIKNGEMEIESDKNK